MIEQHVYVSHDGGELTHEEDALISLALKMRTEHIIKCPCESGVTWAKCMVTTEDDRWLSYVILITAPLQRTVSITRWWEDASTSVFSGHIISTLEEDS